MIKAEIISQLKSRRGKSFTPDELADIMGITPDYLTTYYDLLGQLIEDGKVIADGGNVAHKGRAEASTGQRKGGDSSTPPGTGQEVVQTPKQSPEQAPTRRRKGDQGPQDAGEKQPAQREQVARRREKSPSQPKQQRQMKTRRQKVSAVRRETKIKQETQGKREVEGVVEVTRRGFGFVVVDGMDDVFIAGRDLGGATYGDLVRVRLLGRTSRGNPEGRVLKVLVRGRTTVVGTVEQVPNGFRLVVAEPFANRPVNLNPSTIRSADAGALVYVRITDWGAKGAPIQADVEEVIGLANDPLTDFKLVLRQHDLDDTFPAAVEAEVAQRSRKVSFAHDDHRQDLRDLTVVTIDPASAKDFDDAISLESQEDGTWRLGVHIADVSLYVTPGSLTDREALQRGNSVYFTEGVVPMLPHLLSSDLCSLKPQVDRPAVSAFMTLTADGAVKKVEFARTLIRSNHRFTYEEVHRLLEDGDGEWLAFLKPLKKLTQQLFRRRVAEGSVDFDIPEALFELDDHGVPHMMHPSQRLDSHRMVEECMLLANRVVAEYIPGAKPRRPFLYRVHDEPGKEKIANLSALLRRMNLPGLPGGNITSHKVRDLLLAMEDSPYRDLIETITLRSMAKAAYSATNLGHFGLAFAHYTHFTSPIRRYADLVVHRMLIKHLLTPQATTLTPQKTLEKVAIQCSTRERSALKAERAYQRLKELRFLATQIGKTFQGIISGVIPKGIFVQISEFLVDGFVSVDRLDDDDYKYDESLYALVGRRFRRELQLGQVVRIKVQDVSIEKRLADFLLLDNGDRP
ncbi:MAG: ribonuclease R [Candidatus Marinimicrobia bacterium]|nr:ribonuclease R [Candidatus Neomarinimicrobiota bacterium]